MSMSYADERSLLSHEEFEVVKKTHYPMISDLAVEDLRTLKDSVRKMRDKMRTLAFRKSRVSRGKEDARNEAAGGNAAHAREKKQVFAHALRRVNVELNRLIEFSKRSPLAQSMHSALVMRRKNMVVHHPENDGHSTHEAQIITNKKKKRSADRRKLGRLLQQNKVNQARRDAR